MSNNMLNLWKKHSLDTSLLTKDEKRRGGKMVNLENPLKSYNEGFIAEQEEMDLKNLRLKN